MPDAVAAARLEALVALVRGMAREQNLARLGASLRGARREGREEGRPARTRDFKTVLLPGGVAPIGAYLEVELNGTTGSTFTGQVVKKERTPLPMVVGA